MTIGTVPIRERLVQYRNGPLAHVLQGKAAFPGGTTAKLYLYDKNDASTLAFFPLTVSGTDITIDVPGGDLTAIPDHCDFAVTVTYSATPTKEWNWYGGAFIRSWR
jgi:hypothetical protein